MNPEEIVTQLNRLSNTEKIPGSILAEKLPGFEGVYVGSDGPGDYLCLLADSSRAHAPTKKLRAISIEFGLKYQATIEDSEVNEIFTCLRLHKSNAHLLGPYATLLVALLSQVNAVPSTHEIQELVDKFVELFSVRPGLARDRIKGLFGELTLIDSQESTSTWATAWHESTISNKDFSHTNFYVEVKTAESPVRKHSISVTQLETPNPGLPVYLASILIEEDPRGQSVFGLLASIQTKTPDVNLQKKLIDLTFKTVGLDSDDAKELKWLVSGGLKQVRLYKAEDLPRPIVVESSAKSNAVSAIKFDLNFEIAEVAGVGYTPLPDFE